MSTKKTTASSPQTKKELKKEIAEKIESALPEMKTKLGNEKFQQRIKKAAKIIAHGLHSKDLNTGNSKPKTAAAVPAKNIKTLKKIKVKKS